MKSPFHVAIADRNHAALEMLCKHVEENHPSLSSFLHKKPAGNDRWLTPFQLALKEDNFHVLDVLMKYDLGDLTTTKQHTDVTK